MTESERISDAEDHVRIVLVEAGRPLSSAELGEQLNREIPRSLVRLAVQRLIGNGTVNYDGERRFSVSASPEQQIA